MMVNGCIQFTKTYQMSRVYHTRYIPVERKITKGSLAVDGITGELCTFINDDFWTNSSGEVIELANWEQRFDFQTVQLMICKGLPNDKDAEVVGPISEQVIEFLKPNTIYKESDLIWSLRDYEGYEMDRSYLNEILEIRPEDRIMVRCPWGCFH